MKKSAKLSIPAKPTTQRVLARLILGDDFISPQEIADASGNRIKYNEEQLQRYKNTIPSEEILLCCRDQGYLLIPGPPCSMPLHGIQQLYPEAFYRNLWKKANDKKTKEWYEHEGQNFFSKDAVNPGWIVISKGIIPESLNKSWFEQPEILSCRERIANGAESAWAFLNYRAIRDETLFSEAQVRTSSTSGKMNWPVMVGYYGGLLHFTCHWPGLRTDYIGIMSVKE